ncbi:hypothetical protein SPSIL_052700 [Sporomusa silvacetica DSM 10669]|uniref:RNHCP domain protein n=1 Tax=Sporomusa silvacetica DSM 10669 TaxID=1123289 RepID=A0ABZ3IUD7_9FIRM|nr:hypothetical protein [Sporomusa silvacetica]OZC19639.1 hypothetical protein SPSIL_20690 [Sporomusa silvacetica DSM 10669]
MTNQQSTLTAKCPICSTPATQPEIQETCMRAKSNPPGSFRALLATCVNPKTLKKFRKNKKGEEPCMHCEHNQLTETAGSFIEMQNDINPNTWLEIHICPNCLTTYSVNTQTNATLAI